MRTAKASLLALAVGGLGAATAAASEVSVSYNVDVGPLTVTTVKFSLDVEGEEAHARARIRAEGVSRAFSEFGATAEARTLMAADSPRPVSYKIKRDESDKRKETTVTWSGSGAPSYDPPIKNPDRRKRLDTALEAGVSDPVTALLRMGTTGENPCPSTHRVFDGREVFELDLTDKGMGQLSGGGGAWQGRVQQCSVRWTPIAGRAKDKNVPGDSYDVAFAPVAKLGNGRSLWLPVEMSGKIKGLGFKGYLTKVSGAGE